MSPAQAEAYARAIEAWLAELHQDLDMRLSVYMLPEPPKVDDFR